jgi:hypothetical protein
MNAGLARNIEHGVECLASATFAAAVAFAAFALVGDGQFQLGLAAGALAAYPAYLLSWRVLATQTTRQPVFSIAMFEVSEPNSAEELLLTEADRVCDELVLTDSDRLGDELVLCASDRLHPAEQEPLILDDILEAIGPESRVVRLFDRRAMPTPGDLKSRIDSHVASEPFAHGSPDAAQELADALAELRKALR